MIKLKWYINRLRAMSYKEILWRFSQVVIHRYESYRFCIKPIRIIDKIYHIKPSTSIIPNLIETFEYIEPCNFRVQIFGHNIDLDKINWHNGFYNEVNWPLIPSHKISYKQSSIGDARTNWELNRTYFFPQLIKLFIKTQNIEYLELFKKLFYDWNENNHFLIGISWTSIMEVALRAYQWYVCYILLANIKNKGKDTETLLQDLKAGILNMMEYVYRHYSQYSSANNHLIIEMTMLGIIGQSFGIMRWLNLSLKKLSKEIVRQNFNDGVNKEQSIHYQAFVMESIALYIHMLKYNSIVYPRIFNDVLRKMCEFVSDLSGINGNVPNIGDDDDGKILDLAIEKHNYYKYVLQFCSILLNKNYTDFHSISKNLYFLFTTQEISKKRELYNNDYSKCYREGGYSILKYKDSTSERLMTIDHAELGFGEIAAHGHADALSITLSVDGEDIIIDPGTYIYHTDINSRDYFRKTINHNTIQINNRNQSEMRGPFLWGERAVSTLDKVHMNNEYDLIVAHHDGYKPVIHQREVKYYKPDLFIIKDSILNSSSDNFVLTFCLDNKLNIELKNNTIALNGFQNIIYISSNCEIQVESCFISKQYGMKEKSQAIKVRGNTSLTNEIITSISIGKPYLITDKQ